MSTNRLASLRAAPLNPDPAAVPWVRSSDPWPGWHLVGRYDSDVGCWLLHHGGEACLLEVPEGLPVRDVAEALDLLGVRRLRFATASHDHPDHLDWGVWAALKLWYPSTKFLRPGRVSRAALSLGDEPLYWIPAAKHSPTDQVVVFRGVAMTGDLELGTLESVTDEVDRGTRGRSFRRLRSFPRDNDYRVHTVVSAHLNDVREGVDWPLLFPGD